MNITSSEATSTTTTNSTRLLSGTSSTPSTSSNSTTSTSTTTNSSATSSSTAITTSRTTSSTVSSVTVRSTKRKVCELKCSEIRWFYRRDCESKWTPFNGFDSTVLEYTYRKKRSLAFDDYLKSIQEQLPTTDRAILLNGLYQLSEKDEDEIEPIYWKCESIKIRRGTWFFAETMQPLPTDLADAIEKHHLTGFRGQIIPDSPVFSETESSKKPVLTSLKWNDNEEVRWNSVIDVSISNLKKGNRLLRFVTRAKGTSFLKRGFSEETNYSDGKPNFSDLILVVHGIGQKGYENLIAKNTTQIRESILQLMDKYYADEDRRPIILPIEWRSSLTLDGGMTDVVTLPRMPSMRNTLNSVAMDIMYYQSPLYRTEIVNGVVRTMNNVYSVFMKNNPQFNGSVSIYAHSLGSVIAYDILTNWSPFLLYDEFVTGAMEEYIHKCEAHNEKKLLEEFHSSRKKLLEGGGVMQQILSKQEEQLKFKVKYLFCVGSPLAVFIIMRGANSANVLPDKNQVARIFNIFHPYDPVAYRLEPLFHENYRHVRPVKLFGYHDSRRTYDTLPFECHKSYLKYKKKKVAAANSKGDAGTGTDKSGGNGGGQPEKVIDENDSDSGDDCSSAHTACSSPRSRSPARRNAPPPHPPPPNFDLDKRKDPPKEDVVPDPLLIGEAGELIETIPTTKRIPMRIDFQLQPALTDKSYWSVLKSHFNYWTNLDVNAFVLNTLYPMPTFASGGDKCD